MLDTRSAAAATTVTASTDDAVSTDAVITAPQPAVRKRRRPPPSPDPLPSPVPADPELQLALSRSRRDGRDGRSQPTPVSPPPRAPCPLPTGPLPTSPFVPGEQCIICRSSRSGLGHPVHKGNQRCGQLVCQPCMQQSRNLRPTQCPVCNTELCSTSASRSFCAV
jgi:hypothetical protein